MYWNRAAILPCVGSLLIALGCGGGSQVAHAPRIQKISGDMQSIIQHTAVPLPLQVRVTDSNGNGVPGVPVNFASASGHGYVKPLLTTTDATGLASWSGYLHTVGSQSIEVSAAGFSTVTFTETVTASGKPYDGKYLIYDSSGQPLYAFQSDFFIQDSVVKSDWDFGPYFIAFSDVTGQLDMRYRHTLTTFDYISGTLTLDASGRVIGSGTIMRGFPPNLAPVGNWTAERQ